MITLVTMVFAFMHLSGVTSHLINPAEVCLCQDNLALFTSAMSSLKITVAGTKLSALCQFEFILHKKTYFTAFPSLVLHTSAVHLFTITPLFGKGITTCLLLKHTYTDTTCIVNISLYRLTVIIPFAIWPSDKPDQNLQAERKTAKRSEWRL